MPTNFNAIPDQVEFRCVLATPPEGSVASELVQQFIRRNPLPLWNYEPCINELKCISADKWPRISRFLSTTCRNDINNSTIRTLSHMPLDLLTLVIDFATQHKITNAEVLFALSKVKVGEFDAFIQLVVAHDLFPKPNIWRALVAMPAQYREDYILFCKTRQYDINGLKGDLIFQQHSPESWLEIDNFLNQVIVSDYVLNRLAKMSAPACLDYMRFIIKNKIDDWNEKNILVDRLANIAQELREQICDFACRYNLKVSQFEKISVDMWPRVSKFIERHVRSDNTDLSAFNFDTLCNISEEDWLEFNRFLDAHQIHEFRMIAKYERMSALQRDYLFDFIQKYQPKSDEVSPFIEVSIKLWPSFIALIEEKQLTNVDQLTTIVTRVPGEWEACADLIAKGSISNPSNLERLEHISSQGLHWLRVFVEEYNVGNEDVIYSLATIPSIQHFHFLRAFVDEYNIDDEHVIGGLAKIPSIRQWVNIYTLAQPLFAPPLAAQERGALMFELYKITKQEYRFDRIMPTYDDNERLARIAVVQDRIERGLMPENPKEYYEQIRELLRTPINRLGNMHQAAAANAREINVHAAGRDDSTGHALQQLIALPYDTSQIDNDYAALITYLNNFPGEFTRTSAQFVLGLASSQVEGFAPLSADTVITSYGLNITGKEFLARCWHYIQYGKFIGLTDVEALAKDRENARVGLIQNLADAYEDGVVVCNPGKLQHIAVGILQGRLESAHIDREIPIALQSRSAEIPTDTAVNLSLVRNTVAASLRDFLLHYEAVVGSQAELKTHIDEWLQAERGLCGDTYQQYREAFRKDLDEYLRLSDLPEETVIEMANHKHDQDNTAFSFEQLATIHPLKINYTNLLNTLVRNIEPESKSKWTSGNFESQQVQALRALETFVNNQDESWIIDAANQIKLLTLIKAIYSHHNWAPIHFAPPNKRLGEFLTLVESMPERYGTTAEIVNTLETAVLASQQLNRAISTVDFNELLDSMPLALNKQDAPGRINP